MPFLSYIIPLPGIFEEEEVLLTTQPPAQQQQPTTTPPPEITTFHRPAPQLYSDDIINFNNNNNILPQVKSVDDQLDETEFINSIDQLYPDYASFNAGFPAVQAGFNNAGFDYDATGFGVSEGYERLLEDKIAEIQRAAEQLESRYWGNKMDQSDI